MFRGIWAIIPTPLTVDEAVDEAGLRRLLDYVIQAGVHGVWILGSGGEGPLLSPDSSQNALRAAVKAVNGRVPIAAGVTACSVRAALFRLRMAEEAGVDLVFSAEPYYYKLNISELVGYFLALAEASSLPLVVYHRPSYWPISAVAEGMLPQTFGRLAAHPKIVGIKDVTADFRDYQRLLFHIGSESFGVLTASGRLLLASLAIGGHGGALPEAMLAPKQCVALYDAFVAGDLALAREIQRQLAPLGDALAAGGAYTGAAAMKDALRLLGLSDSHLARPLLPLDDSHSQRIADALDSLDPVRAGSGALEGR